LGKYDKDRFLKELAMQFCLARGMLPFLEVVVPSASELTEQPEVLTDMDVVGVEFVYDSNLRRVLFDCKTGKMSPINRAFWASGVALYAGCDEAVVLLKTPAVFNHRISALTMRVDLHDEKSFRNLGLTYDAAFDRQLMYQSSIDRWNTLFEGYAKNAWSESLYNLTNNVVPLSNTPWHAFRRFVAELRDLRGQFDPAKREHVAIFLNALASVFVLWASIGRDVRRFYDPTMDKTKFESALRYYIWGGKEAYELRRQMREKLQKDAPDSASFDLRAWDKFVAFAGLVMNAPQEIFSCAVISRELAIREVSAADTNLDARLSILINTNKRARQFSLSMAEYLVAASGLPREMNAATEALFLKSD
jgi:hypothetical protein